MKTFTKKTASRIALFAVLLGAVAACTPYAPQTATASASTAKGWVDSAVIPPNSNTEDILVSNSGNGGN